MPNTRQGERNPSVTLKDIAAHCELSVATVSRALRYPTRHSEETTRRIMEAAQALGYDPARHDGARRLVLSRFGKQVLNHLIALIFPPYFYRANYFADIFQGILDVLTPEGFGLLTVDAAEGTDHLLPPSFSRGDIDGVIIASDPKTMAALHNHLRTETAFGSRPILSLMAPVASDASAVMIDARSGAYAATAHLLDLGHRHLLHFCGHYEDTTAELHDQHVQCLLGYRQAYMDRGMDPDTFLHHAHLDESLWRLAFRAENHPKLSALQSSGWTETHPLLDILRRHPEITGILALNDPTAIVIRHILRLGKLKVPQDISLIGFDDTDAMLDDEGRNILTTVRVPLRQVGRRAAKAIIARVTGTAKDDGILKLPTTLVERGSTSRPAR
jgi:LacI family transcriptional regulator